MTAMPSSVAQLDAVSLRYGKTTALDALSIEVPANRMVGLTRRFDDFVAVDNVDFCIERGEIFGFLGSNGCGKSTTMKMLTGLLPASEGQALLFGKTVDAGDMAIRQRVGYMSQAFSLYGELTVGQNLEMHARLFHVPKDQREARIKAMVERFGLQEVVDSLPSDRPMGVRQRLSLAVAVIHKPELLILDEAASGVDPIARDGFWELLIQLSREDGVPIFISTHFMNEALRCDRISLMHAGKVLGSDTPQRLMEKRGLPPLEATFIAYLVDAAGETMRVPLQGSMAQFLLGTTLNLFATTSMGIFFGIVARSMPQLGLPVILVLLPLQILSGGTTPRESMPELVQNIMLVTPTTHFIELAQAILFRGAGADIVRPQLLALTVIGSLFFVGALSRLRKSLQ